MAGARGEAQDAAAAVEACFAEIAANAVAAGFTRLVVAGGETFGAVVGGLGLTAFDIGPQIGAGVPALSAPSLALALKSGNFGGVDFFRTAAAVLAGE